MRAHARALLVFWALPGWLLGGAAALHTAIVNGLLPPLDENVNRLLLVTATAMMIQALGLGLLVAVVRSAIVRGRDVAADVSDLHASIAVAILGAWTLLAPTLLVSSSPRAALGLRIAAAVWLIGAFVAGRLLLRGRPGWSSTFSNSPFLRIGSSLLLVASLALFSAQVRSLPRIDASPPGNPRPTRRTPLAFRDSPRRRRGWLAARAPDACS